MPARTSAASGVLVLHHDYRVRGGEEAAAETLAELAAHELKERVAWLRRSSAELSAAHAARGLLTGGRDAGDVTAALTRHGADLLHAHNLFPTFGPQAVAAAAKAGAATVVHLHNSRLVCAVAVNVRGGRPCQLCSARWPVPGVVHRCRGSAAEAVAYGASLPRWRRGILAAADAVIVPSGSAKQRLAAMGVALPAGRTHIVGGVAEQVAERSQAADGRYALIAGRLADEKDLTTAITATAQLDLPLVIAGDGPRHDELHQAAVDAGRPPLDPGALLDGVIDVLPQQLTVAGHVVFTGRVPGAALAQLRTGARVGLVPSWAPETFGLAALESMAAAVPTIGSAVGALPELLGDGACVPPGDVPALVAAIRRLGGDAAAGEAAASRARELAAPQVVARQLGAAYAQARATRDARRVRR